MFPLGKSRRRKRRAVARQESRGWRPLQRLGAGERSLSLWPVPLDLENWRIKANTVKTAGFTAHPPANTLTSRNYINVSGERGQGMGCPTARSPGFPSQPRAHQGRSLWQVLPPFSFVPQTSTRAPARGAGPRSRHGSEPWAQREVAAVPEPTFFLREVAIRRDGSDDNTDTEKRKQGERLGSRTL